MIMWCSKSAVYAAFVACLSVIVCKCPAVLTPPPNVSWVRCGLICAHGTVANECDKHYLFRSGGRWGSDSILSEFLFACKTIS